MASGMAVCAEPAVAGHFFGVRRSLPGPKAYRGLTGRRVPARPMNTNASVPTQRGSYARP
ncbi:hypothetical protein BGLA2_2640008 [Burkholderia gladioli]|nr:hypothetical protein BGLA2_2640008 [Burkholderia gladioli]